MFTLFVQGGAEGAAGVARAVASLLSCEKPIQVILAVGRSKALAAQFSHRRGVAVLPFTRTIAPYMAAADVIAGKAGASYLLEAVMLRRPFLVTNVVPGQEEPNLRSSKLTTWDGSSCDPRPRSA